MKNCCTSTFFSFLKLILNLSTVRLSILFLMCNFDNKKKRFKSKKNIFCFFLIYIMIQFNLREHGKSYLHVTLNINVIQHTYKVQVNSSGSLWCWNNLRWIVMMCSKESSVIVAIDCKICLWVIGLVIVMPLFKSLHNN